MTVTLRPDRATARRLAAVALGRQPAQLVVRGGALINVFTEEIQPGWGLAIIDGRIAYCGPDLESRIGDQTEILEVDGDLVSPGLIEAHTHVTRGNLSETIEYQVAAGVTTSVVEIVELAFICGRGGMLEWLKEAEGTCGRVLTTVPPLMGFDDEYDSRLGTADDWESLLDHPAVIGVGEIYWADLLRGHARAEALVEGALDRRLAVEGHLAGASIANVCALRALGVQSDHEGITADDVHLRLQLGLYAFARNGATRKDFDAIRRLWTADAIDLGHLALVTDGLEPEAVIQRDSLNSLVDRTVLDGLPLPKAVRLASRNPAERFGLGQWLGGLAPGMLADVVILSSEGGFKPRLVLVSGKQPAVSAAVAHEYPAWMLNTVDVPAIQPDLFSHPTGGRLRAIEYIAPLVTREAQTDGRGDLLCCALDRTGTSRAFRGLLRGFGMKHGAVAWTTGWDTPCLMVVGANAADMALSVQRVASLKGGAAVVEDGEIRAEWLANLGGVQSLESPSEAARAVHSLNLALKALGCPWPDPLLSLETLTSPAIPHLRIWAGGYVRVKDGVRLGLEWT